MTNNQLTSPKPTCRWFQYSLRTLMIIVTLFAIACSWFAVKMQQARRQREAVGRVQVQGAGFRGRSLVCSLPGSVWERLIDYSAIAIHFGIMRLFYSGVNYE
jgi:hypothetical protein